MSTWGRNNGEQSPKKNWSLEEARGKLETYCSYQERCAWELRRKLFEKGIEGKATETILAELATSGFVDEERFSRSYARGKFRMKKWGKGRISRELKLREINSAIIQMGLSEIDGEEYFATIEREAEKKWEKTKEKDAYKKRYLVTQYLMSKGFEQDLIQEALSNLISQGKE
ncbi:MAG: regulatory protein RecX [Bacteroidetes bacterium]|nr:regulatory protein RecX [Bacteroidota bacterium]